MACPGRMPSNQPCPTLDMDAIKSAMSSVGVGVGAASVMEADKDACYHKVKSRYKIWPSAYASGALVRCRKVGAANWGNKSKK